LKRGRLLILLADGGEDDTEEKTGQRGNERQLKRPCEVLEIAAQSCA
jgi:hypothetical protein